jgi:hypothetical protein
MPAPPISDIIATDVAPGRPERDQDLAGSLSNPETLCQRCLGLNMTKILADLDGLRIYGRNSRVIADLGCPASWKHLTCSLCLLFRTINLNKLQESNENAEYVLCKFSDVHTVGLEIFSKSSAANIGEDRARSGFICLIDIPPTAHEQKYTAQLVGHYVDFTKIKNCIDSDGIQPPLGGQPGGHLMKNRATSR